MARKKKASKVKAKSVTHTKGKGTEAKDVLVDGPADEEQVAAPVAIVAESMCYNRQAGSGNNVSGNSKHMTVAEAAKKFG